MVHQKYWYGSGFVVLYFDDIGFTHTFEGHAASFTCAGVVNGHAVTQKRKGRQGDCPDRHWRRWRQASTSPVTSRAVSPTAFSFQWMRKAVPCVTSSYTPLISVGINFLSRPLSLRPLIPNKAHPFSLKNIRIMQQWWPPSLVNTFRPRQNGRRFPDDIFKCIFLNENIWILIKISLKFVPKWPINSIPTLVQIMAWRGPGDKPLSEPMMVYFVDAYMRLLASMRWVVACLFSDISLLHKISIRKKYVAYFNSSNGISVCLSPNSSNLVCWDHWNK